MALCAGHALRLGRACLLEKQAPFSNRRTSENARLALARRAFWGACHFGLITGALSITCQALSAPTLSAKSCKASFAASLSGKRLCERKSKI